MPWWDVNMDNLWPSIHLWCDEATASSLRCINKTARDTITSKDVKRNIFRVTSTQRAHSELLHLWYEICKDEDDEYIELFLKYFGDSDQLFRCNNKMSSVALYNGTQIACRDGNLALVKHVDPLYLLSHPSFMYTACMTGRLDVVKYLHLLGGSLKSSYIHHAAKHGHLDVVKYLVEKGVVVNQTDDCVNEAYYRGHFEVVDFLLNKASSSS